MDLTNTGSRMGQRQSFLSYLSRRDNTGGEIHENREIRTQWHQDTNATLYLGEQEEVRIYESSGMAVSMIRVSVNLSHT